MDLTDQELQQIADELGVSKSALQSDAVKDCAESVKRDNPDMSKSQAFAVCQEMENEGQLAHITLAELQNPGAISRTEQPDGTVRYENVLLLAPGVWGDAGSGRHILYSEEGIANSADNWADTTVNLFHERDNETAAVGDVDTDSIFLGDDDGGLYGDIVLHMDNPASEFADEALQEALETNGREGLQGPSVELRGEDYRWNDDHGVHELVEGTFNGLGLVGLGVSPGPGSEDAAFAEQTRERAVALASSGEASVLTPDTTTDTHETMNPTELRERLAAEDAPIDVDGTDDDDLRQLAAAFDIELQDEDDEDEDEADESGGEGDGMDGDEPDEGDEDDVDINLEDVAAQVEDIGQRVAENSERIDAMAERFEELDDGSSLSELFDTVSEMTERLETLADADDVEELEQRLQAIEDEPQAPTSLADVDGDEQTAADDDDKVRQEMGLNAPQKPSVRRL